MAKYLGKGESLVTAWAEHASGPGWSNYVIFGIVRTSEGKLVEFSVQPEEQTPEMRTLFSVSRVANEEMTEHVARWIHEGGLK